jgi:hypothetical protein
MRQAGFGQCRVQRVAERPGPVSEVFQGASRRTENPVHAAHDLLDHVTERIEPALAVDEAIDPRLGHGALPQFYIGPSTIYAEG